MCIPSVVSPCTKCEEKFDELGLLHHDVNDIKRGGILLNFSSSLLPLDRDISWPICACQVTTLVLSLFQSNIKEIHRLDNKKLVMTQQTVN